jgi:hypothetical protein
MSGATADYILDEPVMWTNVSSLTPRWLERYSSSGSCNTCVTLPTAELSRALDIFSRTFDYDRSHYSVFALEAGVVQRWEGGWSSGFTTLPDEFSVGGSLEATNPSSVVYVSELIRWLGATYDDLAKMTGISRRAFFYWKQTGATPRASSVRSLLRIHSLIGALVRRFGLPGARKWLDTGDPTPRATLLEGDIWRVENLFRRSFMSQPDGRERYARRMDESSVTLELEQQQESTFRRANRRPRRGSLPGS